jgi:cell division protein FtsI/penicillin-binding protein 2
VQKPAVWLAALTLLPFSSHAAGVASKRGRSRAAVRRHVTTPVPSLAPVIVPLAASAQDLEVSEACRRGLTGVRGSVVAMDPHTGRVIAILNPELGVARAYQPCSVFKIVVAIAGLSERIITPETVYNCAGGCWMWPGHGPINLRRALAVSCNPYFEWVGERLGYEKVQRYAQLLGLGAPSGINLAEEAGGVLPASVPPYRVGHLSSHAKGVTTSAVQLAVLLSATLNGGIIYQPQVSGPDSFVAKERWRLPEGTVLGGLTEGFLAAVNEGSAATAFDPDIPVAGKTGTCSGLGWFASYAPADHPDIVIVVFVRPGTGHLASSVAGRIYQNLYKTPAATLAGGS